MDQTGRDRKVMAVEEWIGRDGNGKEWNVMEWLLFLGKEKAGFEK